jgi:hypothetical protein
MCVAVEHLFSSVMLRAFFFSLVSSLLSKFAVQQNVPKAVLAQSVLQEPRPICLRKLHLEQAEMSEFLFCFSPSNLIF